MIFQECSWVVTKSGNSNSCWLRRWRRVLIALLLLEGYRAITAEPLPWLPSIWISTVILYCSLLRYWSHVHTFSATESNVCLQRWFSSPLLFVQKLVDKDPGLTGNLLVERLVGAHVDLISKEEYASIGGVVCLSHSSLFVLFSWHKDFLQVLRFFLSLLPSGSHQHTERKAVERRQKALCNSRGWFKFLGNLVKYCRKQTLLFLPLLDFPIVSFHLYWSRATTYENLW